MNIRRFSYDRLFSNLKAAASGYFCNTGWRHCKTRVFQYFDFNGSDNKVYFATSNKKSVYAQMQRNANVSFCTYIENYDPVLSVNGKAIFVNDPALKERAFEADPSMTSTIHRKTPNLKCCILSLKK